MIRPLKHQSVMLEQVWKEFPDHARARARRRNNVLAALEYSYEARSHAASLVLKAAVEGRLAAASLINRKIHFHPNPAQDADHARSDLRGKLVYEAGDEE
jgi:hypothetical protein